MRLIRILLKSGEIFAVISSILICFTRISILVPHFRRNGFQEARDGDHYVYNKEIAYRIFISLKYVENNILEGGLIY